MHEKSLIKVINEFDLSDVEELLIEIGKGNINSREVLNFLYPNKQNPKNSIPIFKATNKEYNIAVITPAHSNILLFIKVF